MRSSYRAARLFCEYLATLPGAPVEVSDLAPSHIDGFLQYRRDAAGSVSENVRIVKLLLRHVEGKSEDLTAKLHEPNPRYVRATQKTSYTREEFKRIAEAARSDLRIAAQRIRNNRQHLERYRAKAMDDPDRRLELLDFVDQQGDVPRYGYTSRWGQQVIKAWVQRGGFGTVTEIVGWAHLSCLELAAGAILLGVMTGQNRSVILDTPAAHHRADGHIAETTATAIVDAHKPRRGKRAYMNVALEDVPDWISIPPQPDRMTTRDELHTPFGVYSLLLDLTARSRALSGSGRLLVGFHGSGGYGGLGRGLRPIRHKEPFQMWSAMHDLRCDTIEGAEPTPLSATLDRIRLTYLELHQKPVAHTEFTLVNDYLGRNRGNLSEYRDVVAAALREQVDAARSRAVMEIFTKEELAKADPDQIAAEHHIGPTVFKRMLAGELDTVMNACIDNENSPHSPAGQPCRASFMTCLECPCARALPHHLPIQVLVHDRLERRRADMTPMAWTQRFAKAHAQLADLLSQHDVDEVEQARDTATPAQHAMVARFANRELDIR